LINEALPPELRDYDRVLDKKTTGALATQLAQKYPDKYREVMKHLHDIAHDTPPTRRNWFVVWTERHQRNAFGQRHADQVKAGLAASITAGTVSLSDDQRREQDFATGGGSPEKTR
jgi:hypothetical protein